MIQRVNKYINNTKLISPGELVIVALSGGADSVALLLILQAIGYPIIALHCNFHLRGNESDRDEHFVTDLCHKLGVELRTRDFDTKSYALTHHKSIEMAARELRYEWFNEIANEVNSNSIAVAHHMNDQAETILLNLVRGTGLHGLKGMLPRNDKIVRPLLCVNRDEIIDFLGEINQDYVTDSTNFERDAVRNCIRLDILPLLKEINPSIINTLCDTCKIIEGAIPFFNDGIKQAISESQADETQFPLSKLDASPRSQVLLHEWLLGKGFTRQQKQDILQSLEGQPGKMWYSESHQLLRDRDKLILQPSVHQRSTVKIKQEYVSHIESKSSDVAYFDAELLSEPLVIRNVQPGDWFIPFGMTGRKLVSDFLTDKKLTRFQKEQQQVVTCGNNIIWLVGLRSDNRYRVTNNTTKILKLSLII